MMDWHDFDWRGIARWALGGGALIGAAGIMLSETLFSPQYEVRYSSGVSTALCENFKGKRVCTFIYALSVGNTGKEAQESVRITWPMDMREWELKTKVADIIGSARKTQRPRIEPTYDAGTTVYTISGLMPNTLVDFEANCFFCTPAQLQIVRQARPEVEARGGVSEGDPRASALMRGLMNALRLVGLFN
jgi:hypothetical protein